MKPKKKRITQPPVIKRLAERLFNVGMEGWRAVDKTKAPMRFDEIDHPGQLAGWYAIAKYVWLLKK